MKRLLLALLLICAAAFPAYGAALPGTIEAASSDHVLAIEGRGSVGIQIKGTWTGTIAFEGTLDTEAAVRDDTATWVSLAVCPVGGTASGTSTTANGIWTIDVTGLTHLRAFTSAGLTGSATALLLSASPTGRAACTSSFTASGLALESGGNLATIASNTTSIKSTLDATATQLNGRSTMIDALADDIIAAQGAGFGVAVMACIVTNAHATVDTRVELRDGTTVKIQPFVKADGRGFVIDGGGLPLFITASNAALTARAVTTGADIDVFCSGYKATL